MTLAVGTILCKLTFCISVVAAIFRTDGTENDFIYFFYRPVTPLGLIRLVS
jgi:hypothetical protein